jgi:hypothetical protein
LRGHARFEAMSEPKNDAMKSMTPPTKATELAKPYVPTARERSALDAHLDRRRNRKPSPSLKISMKGDVATISTDHADEAVGNSLLLEALGTADVDFLNGFLAQLANVGTKGRVVDESGLNFMLAVVKGIEPRDQVEAMLAAQMAAVHAATMTFARRLNHVENIPQQDSAERAFNKLARTFAAQVEALKRYRSAGEQTVRVEHVTVNEGGQAIVGSVTHGGRGTPQKMEATS